MKKITLALVVIASATLLISLNHLASVGVPGPEFREIVMASKQFKFNPDKVVVSKGERLRIVIKSLDVTHGFGISEYNMNFQTPPGQLVMVEFVADKVGTFTYFCTVFCGTGHPYHRGVLEVVA